MFTEIESNHTNRFSTIKEVVNGTYYFEMSVKMISLTGGHNLQQLGRSKGQHVSVYCVHGTVFYNKYIYGLVKE